MSLKTTVGNYEGLSLDWEFHLFIGLCLLYILELIGFLSGIEPYPNWIRVALTPGYIVIALTLDYWKYSRRWNEKTKTKHKEES